MRKFLLLAGIFTVLAYNAQARYYEEDGYYYEEQPRYERQVRYRNESTNTRKEPKRYQRMSNSAARQYQERQIYREDQSETSIKPYIGIDAITSNLNFGNGSKKWPMQDNSADYFDNNSVSVNLVAGLRINKNWGIEAFYQQSGEEDKTGYYAVDDKGLLEEELGNSISFKAYGVDIQGYAPVTQDFELLASLGIAKYDFEATDKGVISLLGAVPLAEDKNKQEFNSLGVRLGIGGQYYLTDNLAIRAMARYVYMTDDEYIKNLTELSLGLRYMF